MHTFGLLTTLNLFIWQYESLNKYIAKLKDINKNEKITLKLYRARYPRHMKSKGQAVFEEKECPRCGANFMPDKNGCCSYCGYQLSIDNSKWRIDYE